MTLSHPVDWRSFEPQDRATLLFVFRGVGRDQEVLLIRKKRGLGAGKINAPGGRIEPGETTRQAALRECKEEVCIDALSPSERGELSFQFLDGYSLHCTVFVAFEHIGEVKETEEAIPLWVSTGALPYEEMWQDDQYWLPLLLAGECFVGRFVFDGDKMLSKELSTSTSRDV